MRWLIKPSGHLPYANCWPLLGIQSPAETEIEANNVVSIIRQKSACNYFLICHPFDINISTQGRPNKDNIAKFCRKNVMGCNCIRSRRAEEPRILEKQIPTRGILDNTITQSSIVIFCIRYLNNRRDFIIIFSVSWIIFFSS